MIRFSGKIYDDESNEIIIDNIDRAVQLNLMPYYRGEHYANGYVRIEFSIAEEAFDRTGISKLIEDVDKMCEDDK